MTRTGQHNVSHKTRAGAHTWRDTQLLLAMSWITLRYELTNFLIFIPHYYYRSLCGPRSAVGLMLGVSVWSDDNF